MDIKFYEEEIRKSEAKLDKLNADLFSKKKEIADYKERGSDGSIFNASVERIENEIKRETDKLNEYSNIISDYNAKLESDNLLTEDSVAKYKSEVEKINLDIRHFNAQIDYLNKNRGRMSESHYYSEVDRINSLISASEQKKTRCEKLIENYDKKLMLEQKINESKLRVEKYQNELASVKDNLDKEVYEQTILHLNNMIKVELDGQQKNMQLIEDLYNINIDTVVRESVSSNEVINNEKIEELVEEKKEEIVNTKIENQAVSNTTTNSISSSVSVSEETEKDEEKEEVIQTVSNVFDNNNSNDDESLEEEKEEIVDNENTLSGSKIVSSDGEKYEISADRILYYEDLIRKSQKNCDGYKERLEYFRNNKDKFSVDQYTRNVNKLENLIKIEEEKQNKYKGIINGTEKDFDENKLSIKVVSDENKVVSSKPWNWLRKNKKKILIAMGVAGFATLGFTLPGIAIIGGSVLLNKISITNLFVDKSFNYSVYNDELKKIANEISTANYEETVSLQTRLVDLSEKINENISKVNEKIVLLSKVKKLSVKLKKVLNNNKLVSSEVIELENEINEEFKKSNRRGR